MALPVHSESYNPPSEYLLDEDEAKKWEETEPEDRKANFLPQKYDALRKVIYILFVFMFSCYYRFLNMIRLSLSDLNAAWIFIWHLDKEK